MAIETRRQPQNYLHPGLDNNRGWVSAVAWNAGT